MKRFQWLLRRAWCWVVGCKPFVLGDDFECGRCWMHPCAQHNGLWFRFHWWLDRKLGRDEAPF